MPMKGQSSQLSPYHTHIHTINKIVSHNLSPDSGVECNMCLWLNEKLSRWTSLVAWDNPFSWILTQRYSCIVESCQDDLEMHLNCAPHVSNSSLINKIDNNIWSYLSNNYQFMVFTDFVHMISLHTIAIIIYI